MNESPTPILDAMERGDWIPMMLRLIGERAREEAEAELLRPVNVVPIEQED